MKIIGQQHLFIFAGFLVLWLTMLYPNNSSAWIWVATAGISASFIILPQICRTAGSFNVRQWIWTVSAFCGVSVFFSIMQMLNYPIVRGIDSDVPWLENRQWARAGGVLGLPISWLAWKDWSSSDLRASILVGTGLIWSLLLVPVFAGIITLARRLVSSI